jgi:thiamine kinase-like enzyme
MDTKHRLVSILLDQVSALRKKRHELLANRCLFVDGTCMDCAWFARAFASSAPPVRYCKHQIVSGPHSEVDRVDLTWGQSASDCKKLPKSLLVKRAVVRDLLLAHPRSAQKLERDAYSYYNECSFLEAIFPTLLSGGVLLARLFFVHSELRPGQLEESSFLVCSEYLSDYEQHTVIPDEMLLPLLSWVARFHGQYWGKQDAQKAAAEVIWPVGGHWDMEKRRKYAAPNEVSDMPGKFDRFCSNFASVSPLLGSMPGKQIGQRLANHAEAIGRLLAEASYRHKTVIHGDLKQGNLFFSKSTSNPDAPTLVTAIDWQWSGVGLACQDLAYLCNTALSDEAVADVTKLLSTYRDCLAQGGGVDISLEELLVQFKLSLLDYARWVFSYATPNLTPEKVAKAAAAESRGEGTINAGIYRRSVKRLEWLVQLTANYLDEFDAGKLTFNGS